jgi:hypothetical protein
MRLLDTGVNHLEEDRGVLSEVDHQLLGLLHAAEGFFVYEVGVVEEEVIF